MKSPNVIVNLRRRRGDPDARARRDQERLRMIERLEATGRWLLDQNGDAALIIDLATGAARVDTPERFDRATAALRRYADHLIVLFQLFEAADSAVVDALKNLGK